MQANTSRGWAPDEIILLLTKSLNEHYVFPDMAKEMGDYLERKLTRKDYEDMESPEAFCEQITNDLREKVTINI